MFVPSILKICPTDEGTGIYLEWTVRIIICNLSFVYQNVYIINVILT